MQGTEKMIEEVVAAMGGESLSARQKYYLKETLRALVRMAKAEHAYDTARSVQTAVGRASNISEKRECNRITKQLMNRLQSRQFALNFES